MREVLGRCDSDHLDIGCHSNGDHVLLQALADTDAGVETAGHHVAEAVVDDTVERSRPVPSRLTVFLQPSRQRYRGRRPGKIDQLVPIVVEIEHVPSRRNSRLNSRAQIFDGLGRRSFLAR
jgi:hypothetical protein